MLVGAGAAELTAVPSKPVRLNHAHPFITQYHNKVMLSQFAGQYYILDPSRQNEDPEKDVSQVVWVQLEDSKLPQGLMADEMARTLSDYGDFNVYKDSQNSFFLEFYYMEPKVIPTQTVDEFIKILFTSDQAQKRGIKNVVPYKEAAKFKAHNRLE